MGDYKPAMLENGVRVMVPPFIEAGERIIRYKGLLRSHDILCCVRLAGRACVMRRVLLFSATLGFGVRGRDMALR